jgi:hypothetical protein
MADAPTGGPLVRAHAVMDRARGCVLSHREDFDGLNGVRLECCAPRDPRTVLSLVDADVIIADYQHWRTADADGRPVLKIGFAHREQTMWDLDTGPLHPWCAPSWHAPDRAALREELGADERPLVVTMSPSTRRLLLEQRLEYPAYVKHVQARTGLDFWAADLIVTSAGWSSYHEATMSGVPFCAIDFLGQDQHLRATHTWSDAQSAINNARVAIPIVPHRHDWPGELLSLL